MGPLRDRGLVGTQQAATGNPRTRRVRLGSLENACVASLRTVEFAQARTSLPAPLHSARLSSRKRERRCLRRFTPHGRVRASANVVVERPNAKPARLSFSGPRGTLRVPWRMAWIDVPFSGLRATSYGEPANPQGSTRVPWRMAWIDVPFSGLRATGYELRATRHKLLATGYWPQAV